MDSIPTGGTSTTGGSTAAGGTPAATGGALGTAGGTTGSASGGSAALTGGVGGLSTSGGNTSTGGSGLASGGSKSTTGGVSASGGSAAAGASSATGGATLTGGTGGATATSGCGKTTLPTACTSKSTGSCKMDVGGTEREYFLVLPESYDPNTPYPLIFTWHGLTGTAQQLLPGGFSFGGSGGFYGVRAGMPKGIYVTAQGLPSTDGGTDYGWPNTGGRDINFTKAMIDSIETSYCVDKKRVFSTGMSYGGMMSNLLGCQMPDVFRAIAPMSGALFGGARSCVKQPVAAWYTHGDADDVVAISGDVTARDLFIQNNGCDTTNTKTAMMSDGKTSCTIYEVCTAGNYPVVWCPVPGGGHTVPSWAGAEIAKFFLQF